MRRDLKPWLPVMIWMAVIFIASTSLGSSEHTSRMFEPLLRWVKPDITAETTSFIHFLIRKTGHLSEYAVLGILIMRAVRRAVPQFTEVWARRALLIAWVSSTAYAATDELHQVFVDGRTPALGDVAIVDEPTPGLGDDVAHEPVDREDAGHCRRGRQHAPPPGAFDARTVPPWRSTMARTIERPRPLPDGTRVPAREASAL